MRFIWEVVKHGNPTGEKVKTDKIVKDIFKKIVTRGARGLVSSKEKVHQKVRIYKSDLLYLVACKQAHLSMLHMGRRGVLLLL